MIVPRCGESDDEEAGEGFCSMEKYIFYKAALYTLGNLAYVVLSPLSNMVHIKSVIILLFHRYDFTFPLLLFILEVWLLRHLSIGCIWKEIK